MGVQIEYLHDCEYWVRYLSRRGRVPARGAFTLENMEDVQPPGSRTITTDFCVEKSSRFARTPRLDGQLVKNGEKNSSIF